MWRRRATQRKKHRRYQACRDAPSRQGSKQWIDYAVEEDPDSNQEQAGTNSPRRIPAEDDLTHSRGNLYDAYGRSHDRVPVNRRTTPSPQNTALSCGARVQCRRRQLQRIVRRAPGLLVVSGRFFLGA